MKTIFYGRKLLVIPSVNKTSFVLSFLMAANWCAPNNKTLSSKINQCSRFPVCRVLSSSSRRLSGEASSSSFSLSLVRAMKTWSGRVPHLLCSQLPCRSGLCGLIAGAGKRWNVLSDQLEAVILDSLFHRTSTWSCFYSLIFNSWNLFGNSLGFWNGKEKLWRALRAAAGTRCLAGSNPAWQPQPRSFTGAFWRI